MVLKGLAILSITAFLLLTVYGGEQKASNSFVETKEMVVLRKIGHELLLASGDSNSRVLPLQKISATEYQLFFETELAISTDSFMRVVNAVAGQHILPGDVTANIVSCAKKEIVYGTFIGAVPETSIVTCLGRPLPKGCYYIHFIFSPAGAAGLSKTWYAGGALLSLAALLFLVRSRRKKSIPVADQGTGAKTNEANFTSLGKFRFYPELQYLQLNEERIPLTIKETKLLQLFAASPNIILDRATLQAEIWEKEGVIVTRSLDMFVSKLRKKIQGDPSLRIENVHGVGYKLVG